MANVSSLVSAIIDVCYRAGKGLMRDSAELRHLSSRSGSKLGFYENSLTRSEELMASSLAKLRPTYHLLTKVGGYINLSDWKDLADQKHIYRWVIDSIDSGTNFINGHTSFSTSVSLERVNIPSEIKSPDNIAEYATDEDVKANVLVSVVYFPANKITYWAEKGVGAYVIDSYGEQKKIFIKDKANLNECVFSASLDSLLYDESSRNILDAASSKKVKLRCSGSIAEDATTFAKGTWDGFIAQSAPRCTRSPLALLMKEAGATFLSTKTKQIIISQSEIASHSGFIASNDTLIAKLKQTLNK